MTIEECRNFPTNDFQCSSSAMYEQVSYMSISLFSAGMFYKVARLILEGFKLVLIVVGSVRPFIFHNIHHGAS